MISEKPKYDLCIRKVNSNSSGRKCNLSAIYPWTCIPQIQPLMCIHTHVYTQIYCLEVQRWNIFTVELKGSLPLCHGKKQSSGDGTRKISEIRTSANQSS